MFSMEKIIQKIDSIDEKIERILIQTTKTNGRVDFLEDKTDKHEVTIASLLADKNQSKGSNRIIWIVVSAAGAVGMLLIGWFLNKI